MSATSRRRTAEFAALHAAGWTTFEESPWTRLRGLLRRRTRHGRQLDGSGRDERAAERRQVGQAPSVPVLPGAGPSAARRAGVPVVHVPDRRSNG